MSHALNILNDKASMAYIGETPWHGLGQKLTEGADIDTWKKEAGMSYTIKESLVTFKGEDGEDHVFNNKKVLYRDDIMEPLGVVGGRYHVVQPEEVLEFFRDLTEERGFVLETAGVLFQGAKYWAMARTPHELQLGDDKVKEHLLLATACDGSLATTARYVRTRVVCQNTLNAAMQEGKGSPIIRVEHRSKFNSTQVKKELKLVEESWNQFSEQAEKLASHRVCFEDAARYYIKLFGNIELPMDEQTSQKPEELYLNFLEKDYLGSNLAAADQTLWGMLNVVTEHVDWHQGKIQDRRLKSAWLGKGADLKVKAFNLAVEML